MIFTLIETGVECKAVKKSWKTAECNVVRYYRFEGMSDPDDNTILYVIETQEGEKGLLMDAYGVDSGAISPEMLKKLHILHNE